MMEKREEKQDQNVKIPLRKWHSQDNASSLGRHRQAGEERRKGLIHSQKVEEDQKKMKVEQKKMHDEDRVRKADSEQVKEHNQKAVLHSLKVEEWKRMYHEDGAQKEDLEKGEENEKGLLQIVKVEEWKGMHDEGRARKDDPGKVKELEKRVHNEDRVPKEDPGKVREEDGRGTQEIAERRHEDMIHWKKQQQEGWKSSRQGDKKFQSAEARKAQYDLRKRIIDEKRVKVEQRKLDEDMKKWREEETLRRAMEDKTKITQSERLKLHHQRQQVEDIMKITRELTRTRPADDAGMELEREDDESRVSQNSGGERQEKEKKTEAEIARGKADLIVKKTDDMTNQTDSEEDDWHILAKLKEEEDKRKAMWQSRETRNCDKQAICIKTPDYYTAKLPDEEFCITQILKPKQEMDKKRAARLERAKREKDRRSKNLDHHIQKMVSKSTRIPTNLDNEMLKLIEKANAIAAREGIFMEEVLASKETREVERRGRTKLTTTGARKHERKARGQKGRTDRLNADMGLSVSDRMQEENRKFSPITDIQVKSCKKDESKPNKDPTIRNYGVSYGKPVSKPRHVLEPIPFLKFDGSPCVQDSPCKIKNIIRR